MIPQVGVVREGGFLPWAAFRMEHIPLLLKLVDKWVEYVVCDDRCVAERDSGKSVWKA
jgi:hypothetical protein